jgi:ABC-type nitrate/sulfonate/bicarbonate transport system substrate-binding protein
VAHARRVASRRSFLAALAAASASAGFARVPRLARTTPVRIATGVTPPSIHNIWLHVAYEQGFFRDNGLDVRSFVQLQGGPLAIQAIAARQVDIVPADPEGLLAAVLAGHQIRGVAAPGAHLSYMVALRRDVGSMAGLKGRAFAISRPGAISQYLMFPLLTRAGLTRDSVQWLSVGGGYERMLALTANRVQGALLNVDFAMAVASDPNIVVVQSVADVLPDYPVELLVLAKSMIDGNPDAAVAAARAAIQACRFIVQHKAETLAIARRYTPGMDAAVLGRAYDELLRVRGFGVDGGLTAANLETAHDLALSNGQIDRPVPVDRWVDLRIQTRAVTSLGPFA